MPIPPSIPVVAELCVAQYHEVLGRLVSYHLFIKRRSSVSSLLISLVIYCHFARDSRLIRLWAYHALTKLISVFSLIRTDTKTKAATDRNQQGTSLSTHANPHTSNEDRRWPSTGRPAVLPNGHSLHRTEHQTLVHPSWNHSVCDPKIPAPHIPCHHAPWALLQRRSLFPPCSNLNMVQIILCSSDLAHISHNGHRIQYHRDAPVYSPSTWENGYHISAATTH